MARKGKSVIPEIVGKFEREILDDWVREQHAAVTQRQDLISRSINARVILGIRSTARCS